MDFAVRLHLLALVLVVNLVSDQDMVCYDDYELGCFDNTAPWRTFTRPVPAPANPKLVNTTATYWSRGSHQEQHIPLHPFIELHGTDYDKQRPTFFLVIGFMADSRDLFTLKDAILHSVDANLFIIDWVNVPRNYIQTVTFVGARFARKYCQAVSNTRIVGAEIARLATYLTRRFKAHPKDFQCVGHSLGAQICGYMGKNLSGLGQIIGLDAARPLFETHSASIRLNKTDALFVVAYHTNGEWFIPFIGLGFKQAIGDVDFFVNGGMVQPGCGHKEPRPNLISITQLLTSPSTRKHSIEAHNCSHIRALDIYTEAVRNRNCSFWGHKPMLFGNYVETRAYRPTHRPSFAVCTLEGCTPAGLDTVRFPARGSFYLHTSSRPPFCVAELVDNQTMYRLLDEHLSKTPQSANNTFQ